MARARALEDAESRVEQRETNTMQLRKMWNDEANTKVKDAESRLDKLKAKYLPFFTIKDSSRSTTYGQRFTPVGPKEYNKGWTRGTDRVTHEYRDRIELKRRFMNFLFGGPEGSDFENAREVAENKKAWTLLGFFRYVGARESSPETVWRASLNHSVTSCHVIPLLRRVARARARALILLLRPLLLHVGHVGHVVHHVVRHVLLLQRVVQTRRRGHTRVDSSV